MVNASNIANVIKVVFPTLEGSRASFFNLASFLEPSSNPPERDPEPTTTAQLQGHFFSPFSRPSSRYCQNGQNPPFQIQRFTSTAFAQSSLLTDQPLEILQLGFTPSTSTSLSSQVQTMVLPRLATERDSGVHE
ncbi:hypothetical protein N7527_007333 [Penicillium freii]|nr:hypothetical protein N7527_007333 [Penicillium freii]